MNSCYNGFRKKWSTICLNAAGVESSSNQLLLYLNIVGLKECRCLGRVRRRHGLGLRCIQYLLYSYWPQIDQYRLITTIRITFICRRMTQMLLKMREFSEIFESIVAVGDSSIHQVSGGGFFNVVCKLCKNTKTMLINFVLKRKSLKF